MALMKLRPSEWQEGPLPGVCVKTGVPTSDRVRIVRRVEPRGLGWVSYLSFWAWFLGRLVLSEVHVVVLPLRLSVWRQHRRRQLATGAVIAGCAVGVLLSALTDLPDGLALLLVPVLAVAAMAALANEWQWGIRVRVGEDNMLLLEGAHGNFVRAVQERRRTGR